MDSGTSIGYQLVLRLQDDRVIAPHATSRRALARSVLAVGRERGLLAFGAADTHLHLLVLCDRGAAGLLARSLETALGSELELSVSFSTPAITPIHDQRHLGAAFAYVQRNARKHGIADPRTTEASSLHDLPSLRTIAPWLAERVRQALPRVRRTDLLEILAMPQLGVDGDVSGDLPDACAAVFGLADLAGRSTEAVRARATGVALATGLWTSGAIAAALGVTGRTVERLRLHPVAPADLEGLRRQFAWRAALRPAGTGPNF